MLCTTCSNFLPGITDRLTTLVGIASLPCRCRLRWRKTLPVGDEDRSIERKKQSPHSSKSSLNLPRQGIPAPEPHHTPNYFPSDEQLSFYIDVGEQATNNTFGVDPMSSSYMLGNSRENGNRYSVAVEDERSVNTTPLSAIPASTHDTRRAKYHMNELGTFAQRLEQSASRVFPDRARNRYKQVIAVLIQWGDDSSVLHPEVVRMRTLFEAGYGFYTQLWLIPSASSHLKLMSLVLHFLEDYGSSDNLMIVYYGGHGVINSSGQTTWLSKQESLSPSLDWSSIQDLFEETESDVLFLLDCCAVQRPPTGGGQGITETIAASGLEPWPPGPGRNLFTDALISVLEDWITRPAFTAAMLHSEVLAAIKHQRPEKRKWADVQKIQDRKTPIYILNSSVETTLSIELAPRRTLNGRASSNFSRPALAPSPLNPSPIFSKFDIYNPSNLSKSFKVGELKIPHVLISVAIEEDRTINVDAWYQEIRDIPALAKYAVVEGIYRSYSTTILMSIPLLIWDMLPDDLAVSFVAYVQSRNLLAAESVEDFRRLTQTKETARQPKSKQLHSPFQTSAAMTSNQMSEIMKSVKSTLESPTLVRIKDVNDLPKSPVSPQSYGMNRYSADTQVSPLSPVAQSGGFPYGKSSLDANRPTTSRGPGNKGYVERSNSPRDFGESGTEGMGGNARETLQSSESLSGFDRGFKSLSSPLDSNPPVRKSDNKQPKLLDNHGVSRPTDRHDSPLHSNPFQAETKSQTLTQTNQFVSRQSTDAKDPFALERYIRDDESPVREIETQSRLGPDTEAVSNKPDAGQTAIVDVNPLTIKRLGRASSRRVAKLDAALTDIFSATEAPSLPKTSTSNRHSAEINPEADHLAEMSATETLIADLQNEARFARQEAGRAWEELGKREREERERLSKLRNGQAIWIGRYQVRCTGDKGPENMTSKAAALLGTILSPREAMEKHRRARSEPRYGRSNSKKPNRDERVKITYPPVPPPKNTPLPNMDSFMTQQPVVHVAQVRGEGKTVEVYQPKVPETKALPTEERKIPDIGIPERKREIPEWKSSRQRIMAGTPENIRTFGSPDFGDHAFPDADPNVMRYFMGGERGSRSETTRDESNLQVSRPFDGDTNGDEREGEGHENQTAARNVKKRGREERMITRGLENKDVGGRQGNEREIVKENEAHQGPTKERGRGRETQYTFFHDEENLHDYPSNRRQEPPPHRTVFPGEMNPIPRDISNSTDERPRRKPSKLVKKRDPRREMRRDQSVDSAGVRERWGVGIQRVK